MCLALCCEMFIIGYGAQLVCRLYYDNRVKGGDVAMNVKEVVGLRIYKLFKSMESRSMRLQIYAVQHHQRFIAY